MFIKQPGNVTTMDVANKDQDNVAAEVFCAIWKVLELCLFALLFHFLLSLDLGKRVQYILLDFDKRLWYFLLSFDLDKRLQQNEH